MSSRLSKYTIEKKIYYGIIARGSEGIEVFKISDKKEDIERILHTCKLRFRFNSHRSIKCYTFSTDEMIDNVEACGYEFFKKVQEQCTEVNY